MGSPKNQTIDGTIEIDISFSCPTCSKNVSENCTTRRPNWEALEEDPDFEQDTEGTTICRSCHRNFLVNFRHKSGRCVASLINAPYVIVTSSTPIWVPKPPDDITPEDDADPYQSFKYAFEEIREEVLKLGNSIGDELLNRMLFTQIIGVMEAYFSDVISNTIKSNKIYLKLFIQKDRELCKEKLSLTEVFDDPDIINKKINQRIEAISFHNIEHVDTIFKHLFEEKLLQKSGNTKELKHAIQLRHDCVHRNGRDKSGNTLRVFKRTYLLQIMETIERFVAQADVIIEKSRMSQTWDFDDEVPF
ncbi:hypothetical protein [Donghicola sp.]|uniref:hypothetical protein n=1 Tax=Donghicola sp. TaxID=1929294 RepID=UPI0025D62B4E|nr:hypothetical protein [Donghicola sp.]MCT4578477.1 hypothetical protein [Donghicola sp.]